MQRAFICDYVRTPIGRYGGALSGVRWKVFPKRTVGISRNRVEELVGAVDVRVSPSSSTHA